MAGMYLGGGQPTGPMPVWGGQPPMAGQFSSGGGKNPMPNPPVLGRKPPGPFTGAPSGAPPATPPNVVAAQSVRPTGASQGFDPSYLQNLATAIGGLFSRPNGNLSFNPLGSLSEISPSTGGGNAPVPGLPSTMLQDALNGLAFMFNPPVTPPTSSGPTVSGGGNGGGGNNGNKGRMGAAPFLT